MSKQAQDTTSYRLDDDSELPPHLVQLFLRSAPVQLRELCEHCGKRDVTAARAQAHKLKGGMYAVGASRLAESLEALRANLAAHDWPGMEARLASVRDDFTRLLAQLTKQLNGGSA